MKNNIQAVLEIEKKAQEIHSEAMKKAEKLPLEADREAQDLLERTRKEAEEEANLLIEKARTQGAGKKILAQAAQKASRMESLAMTHMDLAVNYVIDRIAGRE
jgi:V/A-type H+-transporting ATPase subunit G/H